MAPPTGMKKSGLKSKKHRKREKESNNVTENDHDDDLSSKETFSKEYVQALGGNNEDFEWLKDMEDSEEDLEESHRDEEDIDMNQLKSFIKNLGFNKVQFKPNIKVKDISRDGGNSGEEGDTEEDDTSDDESPSLQSKDKKGILKSEKQNKKDKQRTSKEIPERTSPEKKKKQKGLSKESKIQHSEVSSTTSSVSETGVEQGTSTSRQLLKGYVARSYLMIARSDEKWYENQYSSNPTQFKAVDASIVSEYSHLAARLYQDEVALHTKLTSSKESSKDEWMRKVVTSGVLSDKIAALTLQTQKSPVHSANTLDNLLNMVRKKGRREALLALKEVKQLFMEELLPDDRKLRTFSQHPLLELDKKNRGKLRDERDRYLILWYFEAQLKQKYEAFVHSLESMCHDNVSAVKQKSVAAMEELLAAKPEQEKTLLSQLVNKIGDPDNKVASKTVYLLHKLVENQVAMKGVVVKEVEGLLYRVNVRTKAQYYAMCFLNQMILTHKDSELATKLIIIYFSFFKACTKKKDIDQKMLSAVLTGVNRAYPFAKVDDSKMEAEINTLFKVVHASPFNIGVQALLLLKQVLGESYSVSDRFYSAMYKKLLDSTLENSPRQPMFLNLLYQTLKADTRVNRNKAFVKRILQVCESQQPAFICGSLFLVSELIRLKPGLKTITQIIQGGDDDDEHFVDITPESGDEAGIKDSEANDEENILKQGSNEDVESKQDTSAVEEGKPGPSSDTTGSSWIHHKLAKQDNKIQAYDPLSRNPLYCGAEASVLWELQKLTQHYHPSVILFAEALLKGGHITYSGNPLQDFTLMKFLERFVYKNPKQADETAKSSSVLQPLTKKYKPAAVRSMAVNSKTFIDTPEEQIPIDELFFYRFFEQKNKKTANTKVEDKDDDDDDSSLGSDYEIEDVSDEEFDKILDGMEKEGEDEDAFDFAGEFTRKKSSKKNKKAAGSDDEDGGASSEEDDYLNPDLDDDSDVADFNYSGDDDDAEEFKMGGADDFDEEGFGGSDSGDDFGPPKKKKTTAKSKPTRDNESDIDVEIEGSKKRKRGKQLIGKAKKTKQQRPKGESASLKATAEEIATIMDDNVGAKFDSIGIQAMANRDKADRKQLNWEMTRDKWMRGQDDKSKIREKMGARKQGGKPGMGGRKQHGGKPGGGKKGKGKQQGRNKNKRNSKGNSKQKRRK